MALCTQLDVEQKLQWDITAEPDGTVTALIADAQALIESEVGRTLESATRTEVFDGGQPVLRLAHPPITAITSITEDGTLLVDGTDFMWYTTGRVIRLSGDTRIYWRTSKYQAIDVVYIGGYLAAESEEHDMALEHLGSLCAEVVARAFRKGAENAAIPAGAAGSIQSVSIEGSDSVTYATAGSGSFSASGGVGQYVYLVEDERRQLARYKRFVFGFA